ncbi:VanZ family protein [Amphibacillus sp. Q70]|uniref:VanZ family protein n=1 Tax=Amphibacillus sp. Q70 TaxID=3453416 RepID=UPI003F861CA5
MFGQGFILFLLIGYSIWIIIRASNLFRKRKAVKLYHEVLVHVFVIYILTVIYLTVHPFSLQLPFMGPRAFFFDKQLFYQLRHMADGYLHLQLLYSSGNVLMFIPFGILTPLIFKRSKNFFWLVFTGFLCSLSIELFQALFTLDRRATVDDLVFNTTGAILGYIIFRGIASKRRLNK